MQEKKTKEERDQHIRQMSDDRLTEEQKRVADEARRRGMHLSEEERK